MNEMAEALGLNRSKFAVAHGMHNEHNYSTAVDMGKLSCLMMRDDRFKEIVKTQVYECYSTLPKQEGDDEIQEEIKD